MKTDPCRNSGCCWHDQCPLRPTAEPVHPPAEARLDMPAHTTADPGSTSFNVRLDVWPPVGELRITGFISERGVEAALADAASDLPGLSGLLVSVDSFGGRKAAGEAVMAIIQTARDTMPVVGFGHTACSAGLAIFMQADTRLCSYDAILGGGGSVIYFCDGHDPSRIFNRCSPRKRERADHRAPDMLVAGADLFVVQQFLDDEFEQTVQAITERLNQAPDRVAPLLDGRCMTAEQAVAAGLAHGLAKTEGDAFSCLLDLACCRATTHNGRNDDR